jgi:ABC-type dipeptide/oligopeptide/nickel transport system permease component
MTPGNAGLETYYFEQASHDGDADAIDQLLNPVPLPTEQAGSGLTGGGILRGLFLLILGVLLAMLCLRHPFVLRRLILMVPTLLVISICVFTIIQLPPGDYLSSRIMQLQEQGSSPELVEQEIEALQSQFHFNAPVVERYLRWMGVNWFLSFDTQDEGLLQGNMGRSMATGRSVNSLVGDRITLTFLITLGTVLFTWALAIPIGIYSACRQYSVGDYLITFFGFLGICMPPFFLALVLMAVTNVTGLFSAEYAVQPSWSWGKVLDLLRHVWIPILVMGVAGTAGMIRIMRANLLDELRKPYVITARAKGMRPIRLLFKYPVRVALNPFVSGIGSLFPYLVSGSALVAIVMSLPTVGPLMLDALFSQDMNLAGSMLMVLSLLAVAGTLVSDLLLLWLDPRIRIGGNDQ